MHKMLYHLWSLWLILSHPFRRTYTANVCGHRTKRAGKTASYGQESLNSMALSENGKPDYCLECLAKMAIRCAWCGKPICIGEPVTLYAPKETFRVPKHAVRYDRDERYLVGCLGWNCAATGADRQGFWVPPGKVARVLSPIEMLMLGGNGDGMVIVNDLSDPNDLGEIV